MTRYQLLVGDALVHNGQCDGTWNTRLRASLRANGLALEPGGYQPWMPPDWVQAPPPAPGEADAWPHPSMIVLVAWMERQGIEVSGCTLPTSTG